MVLGRQSEVKKIYLTSNAFFSKPCFRNRRTEEFEVFMRKNANRVYSTLISGSMVEYTFFHPVIVN